MKTFFFFCKCFEIGRKGEELLGITDLSSGCKTIGIKGLNCILEMKENAYYRRLKISSLLGGQPLPWLWWISIGLDFES